MVLLVLAFGATAVFGAGGVFTYPETADHGWVPLCREGFFQSPIDLPAAGLDMKQTPLKLEYEETTYKASHGHSIKWEPVDADSHDSKFIKPDKTVPKLLQLHFHTFSEHWVDGHKFPLEVHYVHYDSSAEEYSVLGLIFELGEENPAVEAALDALESGTGHVGPAPLMGDDWVDTEVGTFNPFSFLQGIDTSRYWSYHGSFTTPPCTEGVNWFVLQEYATVSVPQVQRIIDISGSEINNRLPQPVYERTIKGVPSDPPRTVEEEDSLSTFVIVVVILSAVILLLSAVICKMSKAPSMPSLPKSRAGTPQKYKEVANDIPANDV